MINKKKGFTLIELMIVIMIIAILALVIIVSTVQTKRNARLNNTKTSLKGAILAIVSCNDSGNPVNVPVGNTEDGNKIVCSSLPKARWPQLQGSYSYVAGGNFSANCDFQINTNGDSSGNLRCTCASGRCD